eukprot:TRINITY_DN5407_c0_g1_i1.p1 TRINITY_DN5407_c0_g1~~TRINITY_DN5407_c0_g1_i1.p1  ORF type:complete len:311 (-),score=-13.19 TRINITY_DN5407_c0_g1_i1:972-1904(-)
MQGWGKKTVETRFTTSLNTRVGVLVRNFFVFLKNFVQHIQTVISREQLNQVKTFLDLSFKELSSKLKQARFDVATREISPFEQYQDHGFGMGNVRQKTFSVLPKNGQNGCAFKRQNTVQRQTSLFIPQQCFSPIVRMNVPEQLLKCKIDMCDTYYIHMLDQICLGVGTISNIRVDVYLVINSLFSLFFSLVQYICFQIILVPILNHKYRTVPYRGYFSPQVPYRTVGTFRRRYRTVPWVLFAVGTVPYRTVFRRYACKYIYTCILDTWIGLVKGGYFFSWETSCCQIISQLQCIDINICMYVFLNFSLLG